MTAYDYTAQRWVTGRRGAELRAEQLTEELEILTSPAADKYLKFKNSTKSREEELAKCREELELAKLGVSSPAENLTVNP